MPQGLQVWDANGVLTVSVTDRLARIIGTITTTTETAGVVSDGRLSQGVPFFFCNDPGDRGGYSYPSVWIVNNAVYWQFDKYAVSDRPRRTIQIIYGVY